MRGNRVKEKLNAGQIATAVSAAVNTADMIDFLGPLGFEGFWLEGEHGPVAWDQIGNLSRARFFTTSSNRWINAGAQQYLEKVATLSGN